MEKEGQIYVKEELEMKIDVDKFSCTPERSNDTKELR
jgi:hypothetical protein